MVIDLITGIEYATVGEVPDGHAYWESTANVIDMIDGIGYSTVGEVPNGHEYWELGIAINAQPHRDYIAGKMFALDAETPPNELMESATVGGQLHERVLASDWTDVIDETHSVKYMKFNTPAYAFPIENRAFMARDKDYSILINTL